MSESNRRQILKSGAALAALVPFAAACAPNQTGEDISMPTPPPEPTSSTASAFVDGVAQARMLARGEVSSLELTEAAIARAEAAQPKINAIANNTFETALETAKNPPNGAFAGVPTFIKDLLDWKGAPSLYGSRAFEGYVASADAPFAAAWRKLGIVSLGKSTSPEMGLISSTEPLVTGPTRNPWDTSRIPGGSSGGAAALVAARVVPFAHASDGGGSIRIPAACCGLFGLKPSRDTFPGRTADVPIVDISVNHCVSLTVRDSASIFAAAEAPSKGLSTTGQITGPSSRRLKIAFMPDPINGASLDADTRAGIERTAQLCRDLGHEVIDWTMPIDGVEFTDKFLLYWAAGAAAFAQDASRFAGKPPSPEILEPWTLGLASMYMQRADEMDGTIAYLKAYEAIYHSYFADFDVMLSPTVSTVAPKIGTQAPDGDFDTVMKNVTNFAAFTAPMNVAGSASMSVPIQWSDAGLPIGSMFSAKRGDDGLLLALAYELEEAQPWIDRIPDLGL